VERLWQYLRQHYGSTRVNENDVALRIAAMNAWQRISIWTNPKSNPSAILGSTMLISYSGNVTDDY
jgi:hypothetical protein